jgi:hypothetical protein
VAHPLDGPRHKLGRAEADLDGLEAEIARFLRRDTYEFTQTFDPATGRCTLYFVMKHQPPLGWSVAIGEIVHNLRSALDHLACQLFLASGGTDCEKPRTAFPIHPNGSDSSFRRWLRKNLPGLGREMVAELRDLQPYKRKDPQRDPLAILNRLSNEDKHRLLVPTFAATVPGSTGMIGNRELRDVDPVPSGNFDLPAGPLLEDAPLAEVDFRITGPDPHVEVEPHFPIDIAFRDGGPVVTILRAIGGYVSSEVFNRFQRFFPQPLPKVDVPEVLPTPRPIQ